MQYKYDEPSEITKARFLEVIGASTIALICQAIVDAAHYIDDYDWLLKRYGELLNHPDLQVRGVTVSCIGHLARLNNRADKQQLLSILEPFLDCQDISGRVEDAMEDINTFLQRFNVTKSLDPSKIRFSQSSVNGAGDITQSMKANGWQGEAIDVVRMGDNGLTTLDNTRVLAASRAGINVQANIRNAADKLPANMVECSSLCRRR